ncbi:MAG: acyltransferase [Hydrogenophaga sp.]|uniref:acyltransferase family protein n=1 Tax=Hydrogenophaga sp. TaxID=1904254 RepID=UPI001D40C5B3|nr:acyltransferase [Hydrogenophaga sp.]MBX3610151.1 acyltransferase [Hydrogenophaga sp.]
MKPTSLNSLTGLRGIAAWLVVLYHFKEFLPTATPHWVGVPIALGYLAVDLFFILSGVVLYLNYHASFERPTVAGTLNFHCRRIARIYPLHLAVLLLFLLNPLAIALFSSSGDLGDRYGLGYYLMSLVLVQNWGFTSDIAWNVPAWSISTEFAAYLLFPMLVWLVKRASRLGALGLPLLMVALIGGLAATFVVAGVPSVGEAIARMGLVRCLLEFSMGLVIGYYWVNHSERVAARSGWALGIVVVSVVAMGAGWRVADYVVAPALFCLLVVALLDQRRSWSRLLSSRPLLFLGEVSYSTYLIHYFVKDWVKFLSPQVGAAQWLAYLIVVMVSSVVLYRLVELPFRSRLYDWLSRSSSGAHVAQ